MSLPFTKPIVIKDLDVPGIMGSDTVCLSGDVISLRSTSKKGSVKIAYFWETWSVYEALLTLKNSGESFTISISGYSGNAIFPATGGIGAPQAVAGGEAPQSQIIGTPLDKFNGEINLILLGS